MAAKLLIFRSDGIDRVELTERDLRIGRAPENDIVLQDQDKTVSRYHAQLRHEQGNYILIDVNSQNGVWVDGQRVQRARLEPGRPVVLGKVRIELEDVSARVAPAATGASTVQVAALPGPAPVAAPASPTSPTPTAAVEGERSTRASASMAAPTLASKIIAPKPLAIALGVVVLAVVALMVWTPAVPSSERSDLPEPTLSVLKTTKMPATDALTRLETPFSTYGRTLPGDTAMTAGGAPSGAEAARQQRIRDARVALARDDHARVIQLLAGLPASDETDRLLKLARDLRAQKVDALMRDGELAEKNGDLGTASRRYAAVRSIDPATPGLEEASARIIDKMKVAGTEALTEARQYDALGQSAEAIPLYEKAVAFLPLEDPNRAAARARLIELKKAKQ